MSNMHFAEVPLAEAEQWKIKLEAVGATIAIE